MVPTSDAFNSTLDIKTVPFILYKLNKKSSEIFIIVFALKDKPSWTRGL